MPRTPPASTQPCRADDGSSLSLLMREDVPCFSSRSMASKKSLFGRHALPGIAILQRSSTDSCIDSLPVSGQGMSPKGSPFWQDHEFVVFVFADHEIAEGCVLCYGYSGM